MSSWGQSLSICPALGWTLKSFLDNYIHECCTWLYFFPCSSTLISALTAEMVKIDLFLCITGCYCCWFYLPKDQRTEWTKDGREIGWTWLHLNVLLGLAFHSWTRSPPCGHSPFSPVGHAFSTACLLLSGVTQRGSGAGLTILSGMSRSSRW